MRVGVLNLRAQGWGTSSLLSQGPEPTKVREDVIVPSRLDDIFSFWYISYFESITLS